MFNPSNLFNADPKSVDRKSIRDKGGAMDEREHGKWDGAVAISSVPRTTLGKTFKLYLS